MEDLQRDRDGLPADSIPTGGKDRFNHDFRRTTGVEIFVLPDPGEPPAGYPTAVSPDTYSSEPFASTFEARRDAYVDWVCANPSVSSVKGVFPELLRIAFNRGPVWQGKIRAAMDYIDVRKDCADFTMMAVLRFYLQLRDKALADPELVEKAKRTILDFKYWPDEPGTDSMCYWTENHHIIFSSSEYIAGQTFPDEVFSNSGHTGRQKLERARPRIEKWLDLRFRTGFDEWLSNVYYDEDLPALLNMVDFVQDPDIAVKAAMVADLLLFDTAANSFKGAFVSTHGRTYTKEKQSALEESTIDTSKLLFGQGVFNGRDNMAASFIAMSGKYRMPAVLERIAADTVRESWTSKQRQSIDFRDARKWGYGGRSLESAMGLLSYGGYSAPRTIGGMVRLLDAYGWWENKFFQEFGPFRKAIGIGKHLGIPRLFAKVFEKDLSRNSMELANTITYRTPDYQLSTAVDYRKQMGGDQHHIWQASLGPEAVCFTTHPGGYKDTAPDGYWHGNGFMPRAAQDGNVAIVLYNTPNIRLPIIIEEVLAFTHAWLPQERFDEIREVGDWKFARKDGGCLALWCSVPVRWETEGENAGRELIAAGRRAAWVCELGRTADYGSFENFIAAVSAADIGTGGRLGLDVRYTSPGRGLLEFGWRGSFRRNGRKVPLKDFPRYDNPASRTDYGAGEVTIGYDGLGLELNIEHGVRRETGGRREDDR